LDKLGLPSPDWVQWRLAQDSPACAATTLERLAIAARPRLTGSALGDPARAGLVVRSVSPSGVDRPVRRLRRRTGPGCVRSRWAREVLVDSGMTACSTYCRSGVPTAFSRQVFGQARRARQHSLPESSPVPAPLARQIILTTAESHRLKKLAYSHTAGYLATGAGDASARRTPRTGTRRRTTLNVRSPESPRDREDFY
jgi:hypothetical protein